MDDVTSEQNRPRRPRSPRRLAAIGGLLVGLLLAAYFVLDLGGGEVDCSDFRFDTTAWANDTDQSVWVEASKREEPTVRQRLADGLIRCDTVAGKRHAELTRMLGNPDDYLSLARGADASSWVTGIERGYISIDNEHLLVRFGSDGRAASAELVTD
jgi:hypothetical protein